LASGVDALYLSGRASLPGPLIGRLEIARELAEKTRTPIPFVLGGVEFSLAGHGFHRYRFCLDHTCGRIGLTLSSNLPAIWVQPRADFLRGASPQGAVEWFRDLLESECGAVLFAVSRLDLFADFQGWDLTGDSRHEFVGRARSRHTYEDDGVFNGFIFGQRKTGTVLCRLYDKTIEMLKSGSGYWPLVWGERFDSTQRVLRVEFEFGRNALREYGLSTPEHVLASSGALWADVTHNWLSQRVPSPDQTKARWSVSPAWEAVSRASLGESVHGVNRMHLGKKRGIAASLLPMVVGYLASFGVCADADSLDDLLPHLRDSLKQRERDTGVSFPEEIAKRRRKMGLS
jgi:hypothetical protein